MKTYFTEQEIAEGQAEAERLAEEAAKAYEA